MNPAVSERSSAPITSADLRRMATIVSTAHDDLRRVRPDLAGRLVAACLAQGGAAHFLDTAVGLKDIDLWLFYDTVGLSTPAPARRRKTYDFGPSHLGRHPDDDPVKFTGRRVDVMCRSLPAEATDDPAAAALAWLAHPCTSAKHLRAKPVVLLWPRSRLGEVIWRPPAHPPKP